MIYFLGLILALLPSYLIRFNISGLPTTVLEIMIVVFLLATAAGYRQQVTGDRFRKLGKINYAIIAFVLAGIISTLVSPDQRAALGQLKAYILEPVLLFYAAVLIIKSKEQVKILLKFLLAGATLVSLFGILQYFTYIGLPLRFWGNGDEVERITSFFEYPNALALYLAPLIGFYFTLLLKKYDLGIKKYWLMISLGVMSTALVLTFSRGGLFAVIFICGLLLMRHFGVKKTIPIFIIGILALLAIAPIRQRALLGFSDPSSLVHFDLWKIGVEKILQNPLLGNGLHGFAALDVTYPHNIFLNFWLEMGLLGLIGFSAVIWLAWEKAKQNPSALSFAAGIFLLILLIHGLVDVPYLKNDLSVMFWFVIALFFI